MISNKDYHQGLLQYIGEDRKPNDDFAHDDWLSPMMMMISCASLYIILNTGNKYSILAHDCLYIYIYICRSGFCYHYFLCINEGEKAT